MSVSSTFKIDEIKKSLEENAADYSKVVIPEKGIRISRPDEEGFPGMKSWTDKERYPGLQCVVWEAFQRGPHRNVLETPATNRFQSLKNLLFRRTILEHATRERVGESKTEVDSKSDLQIEIRVKKIRLENGEGQNDTPIFKVSAFVDVVYSRFKRPFVVEANFSAEDKDTVREIMGC